jgi:small-conductance mechanosensitive channel
MLIQTWGDVLSASFQELWVGVIGFVPRLIIAIIVFLVGWVIAAALGKVITQVVRAIKVDKALQSLGMEEPLSRAGFRLDAGAFIGGLVRWFFIIVFLAATVEVLGLPQVTTFLREVVILYLPNVFVAAIILVAAALLADMVSRVVTGAANAAHLPSSSFLGGVSKWAIWIFAILAALFQLGIAGPFVQTLFTGAVAAMALALGLSFGFGGQDAAKRYLDRLKQDISEK